MDLTDIHRALERLDAVLAAAQAALDEDPALPEARHAYLEAYAEARSAQGPPARDATTAGRLAAARTPSRTWSRRPDGGRPHTDAHGG